MSKLTNGLSQEEKKMVRSVFFRSIFIGSDYNPVRQMGHGCANALRKYIEWLYPGEDNKEKRVEAMKREAVLYNMTPYIVTLGTGLAASMEKEARENPDFDPNTINTVKVSLMGPASGVGDSLFWVTLRVLLASIAIPFALKGSILGMIIFLGGFEIVHMFCKYNLTFLSYKAGADFISKAYKSGLLPAFTRAASIMGLVMVGCMVSSSVSMPLTVAFKAGETEQTLVSIFDSIMPGLLGLLLTVVTFKLIRKKINPTLIMFLLIIFGIAGAAIGIF